MDMFKLYKSAVLFDLQTEYEMILREFIKKLTKWKYRPAKRVSTIMKRGFVALTYTRKLQSTRMRIGMVVAWVENEGGELLIVGSKKIDE